jgi:uncharacterized membrane protein YgcG
MSLTQPSPARLGLLLVLLAALFGAALAIGKATASGGGTTAPMPLQLHLTSGGAPAVTSPAVVPALPSLRHVKPAIKTRVVQPANTTPTSPVAPPPSGTGSGSGSSSGTTGGSGSGTTGGSGSGTTGGSGSGGGSGGSGGVIISG